MIGPIKTTTTADMETTQYNDARPHPRVAAGVPKRDGDSRDGCAALSVVMTRDGIELPLYRWPATGGRRARVALLHGLAEHAGRYVALAERLNAAGIELLAIDLRGHGHAPGKRARIDRFDDYLLDAEALLSVAAHDDVPLFLMGHSMGGAIAALYAIERLPTSGYRLAGLILSSPASRGGVRATLDVDDEPDHQPRLARLSAMKIDAALLSRNPEIVEANRNDPLVHHGSIPARTGAEILRRWRASNVAVRICGCPCWCITAPPTSSRNRTAAARLVSMRFAGQNAHAS